MRSSLRKIVSLVSITMLISLVGCASGGGGGSESSASSGSAKAPKGVVAPEGHKLAKVTTGMTPDQVEGIMGEASSETTYMNGKMWIPFYFGPTHQTDWKYEGQGRVVFVNNRWSGKVQSVTRVDYDPKEEGK